MSENINEMFELFDALSIYAKIMKKAIQNDMKERHPCYIELVEELENTENIVQSILEECPKEYKAIINEYIVTLKDLHNYEGDHFYLRGYLDCVRLLYRLNFLS